ncbi:unnamed protein product [Trifolium pratense]|uniref:Uncharacterized protein n=1 Tax=Trifolium pratense TaxID=57577 RepID=A0ACB0K6L0_TRIPR|nr:unnamed protein product [Trifolium pratense]
MLFLLLLPKQPTLLTGDFLFDNRTHSCRMNISLIFVVCYKISADLGETLYSLECFATRIRGIESGPARKWQKRPNTTRRKQRRYIIACKICNSDLLRENTIVKTFKKRYGTWRIK